MSLSAALSIATSSLANVNANWRWCRTTSRTPSTPGYVARDRDEESLTSDGIGMGVVDRPGRRNVNQALQGAVLPQNATVAGLQTTQAALQAIDAVSGTPGQGSDLGSLLGDLQDQFSTLLNDPSNPTQQSAVVSSAAHAGARINALSNTYTTQRQTAENNIVAEVARSTARSAPSAAVRPDRRPAGRRRRARPISRTSATPRCRRCRNWSSVNVLVQSNGNMVVTTAGGVTLPTDPGHRRHPARCPSPARTCSRGRIIRAAASAAIMLGGVDVTDQLTGGQLGANITLRDTTLPTYQAELDEFSQNMASQFAAQGLTLFTDPNGNVPAGGGTPVQSGYVGFAAEIQVNPAVQTDPSLVVDGNDASPAARPARPPSRPIRPTGRRASPR